VPVEADAFYLIDHRLIALLMPNRVWLHTCSLGHPRAMQHYQSHGFELYKTEEAIEQLPEAPLEVWPGW
jgi:hypothetical protein